MLNFSEHRAQTHRMEDTPLPGKWSSCSTATDWPLSAGSITSACLAFCPISWMQLSSSPLPSTAFPSLPLSLSASGTVCLSQFLISVSLCTSVTACFCLSVCVCESVLVSEPLSSVCMCLSLRLSLCVYMGVPLSVSHCV